MAGVDNGVDNGDTEGGGDDGLGTIAAGRTDNGRDGVGPPKDRVAPAGLREPGDHETDAPPAAGFRKSMDGTGGRPGEANPVSPRSAKGSRGIDRDRSGPWAPSIASDRRGAAAGSEGFETRMGAADGADAEG